MSPDGSRGTETSSGEASSGEPSELAGVALQLVSVARFAAALERCGERLLERLFLPDELAYARDRVGRNAHLAARFAAKCAARRALRPLLFGRGTPGFRELEVERARDGRPTLVWSGPHADPEIRVDLSLTHERDLAMASVLVSRRGRT